MKVLVIGGGLGGLTVCTSLRKFDREVEITLIEPKSYMEIHWCSIRNLFDPHEDEPGGQGHDGNWADASILEIKNWAIQKSVKHIKQTCTKLTKDYAELSNGETLEFNVCCVCTGAATRIPGLGRGPPSTKGQHPGSISRRLHQIKHEKKKLMEAKKVAIIGGGLIGVEFAGELAGEAKRQNKDIDITLIHADSHLITNEFTPKAAEVVRHKLEKQGVAVLLKERAAVKKQQPQQHHDEGQVTSEETKEPDSEQQQPHNIWLSNSKRELTDIDQIVWATGLMSVNRQFMPDEFLNSRGWVEVDDYFRVKGSQNKLFAVGDCCDLLPNQGTQILGTLNIIGNNIHTILKATVNDYLQDESKLERQMRKALVANQTYVVTIGKKRGVACQGNCHTQFFLPWMKNLTMFLSTPKSTLGINSRVSK